MTSEITNREIQVLELISKGLASKQIASELFVSNHTVISHKKNLKFKLKASNAAHMVRIGFQRNLIN